MEFDLKLTVVIFHHDSTTDNHNTRLSLRRPQIDSPQSNTHRRQLLCLGPFYAASRKTVQHLTFVPVTIVNFSYNDFISTRIFNNNSSHKQITQLFSMRIKL